MEVRAAKPGLRSTVGKKKRLSIKPRNFDSDVIVT